MTEIAPQMALDVCKHLKTDHGDLHDAGISITAKGDTSTDNARMHDFIFESKFRTVLCMQQLWSSLDRHRYVVFLL